LQILDETPPSERRLIAAAALYQESETAEERHERANSEPDSTPELSGAAEREWRQEKAAQHEDENEQRPQWKKKADNACDGKKDAYQSDNTEAEHPPGKAGASPRQHPEFQRLRPAGKANNRDANKKEREQQMEQIAINAQQPNNDFPQFSS